MTFVLTILLIYLVSNLYLSILNANDSLERQNREIANILNAVITAVSIVVLLVHVYG